VVQNETVRVGKTFVRAGGEEKKKGCELWTCPSKGARTKEVLLDEIENQAPQDGRHSGREQLWVSGWRWWELSATCLGTTCFHCGGIVYLL